jgi:hypothetical protein
MVSWGIVMVWSALDLFVESDLQNGQKSMVSTRLIIFDKLNNCLKVGAMKFRKKVMKIEL